MPPPPSFDRVARIYRWSEYLTLGTLLEHIRFHFLPRLHDRRQALVLGDGDGRFLARLLQQNTTLHATAVDTSATMLRLLRSRCERSAPDAAVRLNTIHASALHIAASPQTDLIVTHFFLDCLTQHETDVLAQQLAAQVAPNCLWLVSDFEVPRHPLLRTLGAAYIRTLYFVFRVLTGLRVTRLPDPQRSLSAAGFSRIERHERCGGLLYTELWILETSRRTTTQR
jgi:SAM-dependent methyltransferase